MSDTPLERPERDPGVEEILRGRRADAPVSRKLPGPFAWFDPRNRSTGSFAFSLNRATGLGLVFYLYLHLAVLSMLFGGEDSWNSFLETATQPLFLGLDVLLVFGLIAHGLNGTRLSLIGSGFVTNHQKALFWSLMAFGAIVLVYSALHIFGGEA
jgi:succinate dehydrogenase / fumarate reductase cytochrome b subunit